MNPEDSVTALSHDYWVKTMRTMMIHPSSNEATKQLAEMCLNLIELNKFDADTIAYLNAEGARAMSGERNGD